jgi:DNA uptake protein ComE-like DNA-binding protein
MKQYIIMSLLLACLNSHAQSPPVKTYEQQLENLAERDETDIEDDSFAEQMEIFRRHPINLNTADQDELQLLQTLNVAIPCFAWKIYSHL